MALVNDALDRMPLLQARRLGAAEAHDLVERGAALLVDVRIAEERKLSGYIRGSVHIPWRLGRALLRNPRFLNSLSERVSTGELVIFFCHSEARSAEAAHAAAKAGYRAAFVSDGMDGWRAHGLPWSEA